MASAETFLERGDVRKGYFSKEEILSRGGGIAEFKEVFGKLDSISEFLISTGDIINNLPANLPAYSVELLSWVYKTVSSVVLYTPLILFDNSYFKDATSIFMIVSAGLVVILTIFEGLKRMFRKDSTGIKEISTRLPIATLAAGSSPWLFEHTFILLNKVSSIFINLSHKQIVSMGNRDLSMWSWLDTFALLGFDVILFGMMFKIFANNGRRWFDLMCLGIVTPLALTAWIFKDYRHYFNTWLSNVKDLSFVHLYYAIFLFIIAMIMFAIPSSILAAHPTAFIAKFAIIIGGMYRLKNPPKIFTSKVDSNSESIKSVFKSIGNSFIFKKSPGVGLALKGVNATRNLVKSNNSEELLKLRNKHGRRYLGDINDKE